MFRRQIQVIQARVFHSRLFSVSSLPCKISLEAVQWFHGDVSLQMSGKLEQLLLFCQVKVMDRLISVSRG